MSIFICEGVNGSGKTTLVNHIVKKYNAKSCHMSKDSDNSFSGHMKQIDGFITSKEILVIDRFNTGETIYPIIWDRPFKLNKLEQSILYNLFNILNIPIFIFYSSNFEILKDRILQRGDDEHVLETLELENKLWQDCYNGLSNMFNNIYGIDIAKVKDQVEFFEKIYNKR